ALLCRKRIHPSLNEQREQPGSGYGSAPGRCDRFRQPGGFPVARGIIMTIRNISLASTLTALSLALVSCNQDTSSPAGTTDSVTTDSTTDTSGLGGTSGTTADSVAPDGVTGTGGTDTGTGVETETGAGTGTSGSVTSTVDTDTGSTGAGSTGGTNTGTDETP